MAELPDRVIEKLDPTMQYELLGTLERDGATYYFVDQFDEFSGDMVIVHDAPGQDPEIVEDLPGEDLLAGGGVQSPALQERLHVYWGEPEEGGVAGADDTLSGGGVDPQQRLNSRFHNHAVRCTGAIDPNEKLISRDAPGTRNGKLACAWAVNRVAKNSLGKQIGGGLATAEMVKVLDARHNKIDRPEAGCVIISPTVTTNGRRNIGHVGIVGLTEGSETSVYSNSTKGREFRRDHTLSSWESYYGGKGLQVRYFNLAPNQFPTLNSNA